VCITTLKHCRDLLFRRLTSYPTINIPLQLGVVFTSGKSGEFNAFRTFLSLKQHYPGNTLYNSDFKKEASEIAGIGLKTLYSHLISLRKANLIWYKGDRIYFKGAIAAARERGLLSRTSVKLSEGAIKELRPNLFSADVAFRERIQNGLLANAALQDYFKRHPKEKKEYECLNKASQKRKRMFIIQQFRKKAEKVPHYSGRSFEVSNSEYGYGGLSCKVLSAPFKRQKSWASKQKHKARTLGLLSFKKVLRPTYEDIGDYPLSLLEPEKYGRFFLEEINGKWWNCERLADRVKSNITLSKTGGVRKNGHN